MLHSKRVFRLRDVVVEVSPSEVLGVVQLSSGKKRTDATFCITTCKDCGCDGDCGCDRECRRNCSCDDYNPCRCECDGQCGTNYGY